MYTHVCMCTHRHTVYVHTYIHTHICTCILPEPDQPAGGNKTGGPGGSGDTSLIHTQTYTHTQIYTHRQTYFKYFAMSDKRKCERN